MASASIPQTCTRESISYESCIGWSPDNASHRKRLPFKDVEVVDPYNYGQPYNYGDGPRLQEFLQEMAEKTFNEYECVLY